MASPSGAVMEPKAATGLPSRPTRYLWKFQRGALLLNLFEQLGVELAPSRMGFSVQHRGLGLEWAGNDLNSVFAQRSNLVRPAFFGMLTDLLRFNRLTTELAERGDDLALAEPVEAFLRRHNFGLLFRDGYLLPMLGCIWSCPTDQMLQFPVATMIRFCHNHGLIQVSNRPQWWTVTGGARNYVERILEGIADKRLSTPVRSIERDAAGVRVITDGKVEHFDHVVRARPWI